MDVLDAIENRRCIRAFLQTPIPLKLIYAILEVARFAPSGVNSQPWEVVVLQGNYLIEIGDAIVNAREDNIPENPDYHYYPTEWVEPYKSRRKACGLALYSSIQIGITETEKRKEAWYRNYYFFGAPVGLLFFIDRQLEKGSWLDLGLFIQNVMLAARGYGLETCPQASLAEYPDIVRSIVNVSSDKLLACGMALGYGDYTQSINSYRTTREPVELFTKALGFSEKI